MSSFVAGLSGSAGARASSGVWVEAGEPVLECQSDPFAVRNRQVFACGHARSASRPDRRDPTLRSRSAVGPAGLTRPRSTGCRPGAQWRPLRCPWHAFAWVCGICPLATNGFVGGPLRDLRSIPMACNVNADHASAERLDRQLGIACITAEIRDDQGVAMISPVDHRKGAGALTANQFLRQLFGLQNSQDALP